METELQLKHKVSSHLRDLLKSDVRSVQDICNWLETNAVKKRDIQRRTVSKRLLARMIAAQIALKAARDGDINAAREIMDRTEGKVESKVLLGVVDLNEAIRQLEAGRQRVLAHRAPQDVVVDGSTIEDATTETSLTVVDSDTSK